MKTYLSALAALAVAGGLALAGCGSSSSGSSAGADSGSAGASSTRSTSGGLATASTSVGTVVVDGSGHTVYVYDRDTKGTTSSACTGSCIPEWPAVHGGTSTKLDGVTGTVGTITGTDGKPQLTLNGWPLYYFADDSGPGDVNGQAYDGIWWVVGADGTKITASPQASPSPDSGSGGYGGY